MLSRSSSKRREKRAKREGEKGKKIGNVARMEGTVAVT